MAWLIGIVCVVIVVIFWRIFVPLGIAAAVLIAGAIGYDQYSSQQRKAAAEQEAQQRALIISRAQANATSEGKEWFVRSYPDPTGGKKVYRAAGVTSNDGLCDLTVEERINGARLTDLRCRHFQLRSYGDIEVKFDHLPVSKKMHLDSYSDSDRVYIPSSQYTYSAEMPYDEFIAGLRKGSAVAISGNAFGQKWVTFTLTNADWAIGLLGEPEDISQE